MMAVRQIRMRLLRLCDIDGLVLAGRASGTVERTVM
jgi:hypothetical protein